MVGSLLQTSYFIANLNSFIDNNKNHKGRLSHMRGERCPKYKAIKIINLYPKSCNQVKQYIFSATMRLLRTSL